jgi:nucleoside-diphosphate-sugar epimerase
MAIEAAEEFMKKEKPAYDLVVMMPTTVLGADGLATSPKRLEEGSNGLLMNYILGKGQMPLLRTTVLIDDVAKAHVMAVNPSIPAGRYFLSSEGVEGTNFPEAFGILKKHFPEAYGTTFAKKADALYIEMGIDTEKTEKTFGFQFKSFEDQVKSVVENYLKLLPK